MDKVSALIQSEALYQFNHKKQNIIQKILNKHKNKENFQDILNVFMTNKQ